MGPIKALPQALIGLMSLMSSKPLLLSKVSAEHWSFLMTYSLQGPLGPHGTLYDPLGLSGLQDPILIRTACQEAEP